MLRASTRANPRFCARAASAGSARPAAGHHRGVRTPADAWAASVGRSADTARFRKVPFTCAYFPGKINLTGLSAMYIYGFTTYSETIAGVESWLTGRPAAAIAFLGGAALACVSLAHWRELRMGSAASLEYEDAGDPVVRTLGLTPQ